MAKKFLFPYEKILEYTAQMTDMKKIEFALARKEYLLAIQKKEEMERSIVITREGKKEMMREHYDQDMMRVFDAYIDKLLYDIENQEKVIAQKESSMETARKAYIEWRKKKKSLELLRENAVRVHKKEVSDEEQKNNDEAAITRHRRRER